MSVPLRAAGIEKAYWDGRRRIHVLRGLDLEVAPGELLAIVGPSGCGKSTLLHILGALDSPRSPRHPEGYAGEVEIAGQPLDGLDPRELAAFRNRTLGFVFQFHQLLPDFTALENVMLPGRIAGRPPAELAAKARALLEEVGLAERLDHFPSQLSGGECQRVALCRALVLDPPLLLADEPTGNLDPASGETVFQLLVELHERHRTTAVLVTHNPELARRCARILLLENGVLQPFHP